MLRDMSTAMPLAQESAIQPDTNALVEAFIQSTSYKDWQRESLPRDASKRYYTRLSNMAAELSVLVMDSNLEPKMYDDYCRTQAQLNALGFSVPQIIQRDDQRKLAIIEDLGVESFTAMLSHSAWRQQELYLTALDVLAVLQQANADPFELQPYDVKEYTREVELFHQWYMPYEMHQSPQDAAIAEFRSIWQDLFEQNVCNGAFKDAYVLRDYHIDNIMWMDGRSGIRSCGLLDFQDALQGHPAYDVATLLQDERFDISPEFADQMLEHYFDHMQIDDTASFMRAYYTLAVQRHCKVLGIFVRLNERDGKPHYLQHLGRIKNYINYCFTKEPSLKDLQQWLVRHGWE